MKVYIKLKLLPVLKHRNHKKFVHLNPAMSDLHLMRFP